MPPPSLLPRVARRCSAFCNDHRAALAAARRGYSRRGGRASAVPGRARSPGRRAGGIASAGAMTVPIRNDRRKPLFRLGQFDLDHAPARFHLMTFSARVASNGSSPSVSVGGMHPWEHQASFATTDDPSSCSKPAPALMPHVAAATAGAGIPSTTSTASARCAGCCARPTTTQGNPAARNNRPA
jgi:hypothetical protein